MNAFIRFLKSLLASWRTRRRPHSDLSERERRLLAGVILRDEPRKYDIDRLKR